MKVYFRKEVSVLETRRYTLTDGDIESLGVTIEFFQGLSSEEQEELLGDLRSYTYEVEDIHEL